MSSDGSKPEWGMYLSSSDFQDTDIGGSLILSNYNKVVPGDLNTSFGIGGLESNSTGDGNTAVGCNTLNKNTEGYSNTAIGYASMQQNISGFGNTSVGMRSSTNNTTGYKNTAVGVGSLYENTTSGENTAIGFGSLYSNTTGFGNTAVGTQALVNNDTGDYNIAIGDQTLLNNEGGNYNIAIGYETGPSIDGLNNTVAIGSNTIVSSSNSIVLGDGTCNLGLGVRNPTYGIHMGPSSGSYSPQMYFTGLSSLPTAGLSSNTDAVLYANNGNLYYGNSTSPTNQIVSKSYVDKNLTPIGSIIMWSTGTVPDNYLHCDGSSLSTTTYSLLFNVIRYTWGGSGTSFRLPDGRGYFPRGFDGTAGRDPEKTSRYALYSSGNTGNNVGSYQYSAIPTHGHDQKGWWTCSYNSGGTDKQVRARLQSTDAAETGALMNTLNTLPTNVTSSTESRPINFGVMFCIRYQ